MSVHAVRVVGGRFNAPDFLRPNGSLGACYDTIEGGQHHGITTIDDENSADGKFGHVLEGGGGVGVHEVFPFIACFS